MDTTARTKFHLDSMTRPMWGARALGDQTRRNKDYDNRCVQSVATLHSLALCRLAYRHWVRRILIVRPSFACAPVEPYVLGTPQSASRFAADRRFKTLRASPSRSTHRTRRDARGAGPLRGCSLFSAKRNDFTHCPDARGQQCRSGHGRLGRGGRNGGRFGIASLFYLCPGSSLGDCAVHTPSMLPKNSCVNGMVSLPILSLVCSSQRERRLGTSCKALHPAVCCICPSCSSEYLAIRSRMRALCPAAFRKREAGMHSAVPET